MGEAVLLPESACSTAAMALTSTQVWRTFETGFPLQQGPRAIGWPAIRLPGSQSLLIYGADVNCPCWACRHAVKISPVKANAEACTLFMYHLVLIFAYVSACTHAARDLL